MKTTRTCMVLVLDLSRDGMGNVELAFAFSLSFPLSQSSRALKFLLFSP